MSEWHAEARRLRRTAEDNPKRRRRRSEAHQKMQARLSRAISRGVGIEEVEADLGFTIGEVKRHLERQFVRGMNWGNYAGNLPWKTKRKTWCIDHIVPKSTFSASEMRAAFAISNLRPLWIKANLSKGVTRTHLL